MYLIYQFIFTYTPFLAMLAVGIWPTSKRAVIAVRGLEESVLAWLGGGTATPTRKTTPRAPGVGLRPDLARPIPAVVLPVGTSKSRMAHPLHLGGL